MSGFDIGRTYNTSVLPGLRPTGAGSSKDVNGGASAGDDGPLGGVVASAGTLSQIENSLHDFLQRFRQGEEYLYRDRLRANLVAKQHMLEIQLEHVQLWNHALAQALREKPSEILPLVSIGSSPTRDAKTDQLGASLCSSRQPSSASHGGSSTL